MKEQALTTDYAYAAYNKSKIGGAYTITVGVTGEMRRYYRGKTSVVTANRHELTFNTNDSWVFDALQGDEDMERYREAVHWATVTALFENNILMTRPA